MKKIVIAIAALLPFALIGVADAAATPRAGGFEVSGGEFPITYPGPGNSNVKNVYFDVAATGMKQFDRSGLKIDCYADGVLVYDAQSTISYGSFIRTEHPVSFYVSLSTPWRGELASCDVKLIWESYKRSTGFTFGGVLWSETNAFEIGVP